MIRNLIKQYGLYFFIIFTITLFILITFFARFKLSIIPGDIVLVTPKFTFYFPLGSAAALSLGIIVLLKFFRVFK